MPTASLQGGLDRVEADGTVEGWCRSPEEPHAPRTVAIPVDGHIAAAFGRDIPTCAAAAQAAAEAEAEAA